MPINLPEQVTAIVGRFEKRVQMEMGAWRATKTPDGFRASELEVAELSRRLADEITAALLQDILSDDVFQDSACAAARREPGARYRGGGARKVTVTLLGGGRTRVRVPYLKPDLRRSRGRKRGTGRRRKGGSGLYPTLAALGIWYGASPALAGEVVRQDVDSDSVRTARQALARRGIDLGHKQTLRLFHHLSRRAVDQRQRWFDDVMGKAPPSGGLLAGKRVVIGTDGGRCRIRIPARAGRPRKRSGHCGYQAPWQEPKLLVLYVVDAQGRIERTFRPVYDGTMGDCVRLFEMLVRYLRAMGAQEAAELIVVADGAKWIWDRVAELVTAIGLPTDRVTEVLDWYHAVETLHGIADIPGDWSPGAKDAWVTQAVRLLRRGQISRLAEHIRSLAMGRRAKKVSSHVAYFERNAHRMQYQSFRARCVPQGSGAVESAVRRVINLRLKATSKFWLREHAEGMLLFRSYLKAGRFDDLYDWSLRRAVPWWVPEVGSPIGRAVGGQSGAVRPEDTEVRYAA
ncbi:MAG: hypothetical protein FJW35_18250 [Acidobacteria bacterium]|nr:hypothetical protein [Acidobacteriota bacterium]